MHDCVPASFLLCGAMGHVDPSLVASTVAVLAYVGLVFAAGVSDILTLTVPNRYPIAIVLVYPSYVLASSHPVDWQTSLMIAGGALVAGFVLYALRGWGGGDAKLFAAVALWAGPDFFVPLVLLCTAAGGVIAGFIWLQHYLPYAVTSGFFTFRSGIPQFRRTPIPYAAAIAVAALYRAFTLLNVG